MLVLILYTYLFLKQETLSELEKVITVYSKVKSNISLSGCKRSFWANHSQMTRFIFMLFHFFLFRKLKMNKDKYKSSYQDEWLSNRRF